MRLNVESEIETEKKNEYSMYRQKKTKARFAVYNQSKFFVWVLLCVCVCERVSFAFHLFPVLTKHTPVRASQLHHVRHTHTPSHSRAHNFSLSRSVYSFLFFFLRTLEFVHVFSYNCQWARLLSRHFSTY